MEDTNLIDTKLVDTNMTWNELVDYLRKQGFTEFRICFDTYYTNKKVPITSIYIGASPDRISECNKKSVLSILTKQKFQSEQLLLEDIAWRFENGYITSDNNIVKITRRWKEFSEKCEKIKCELTGNIYREDPFE